MNREPHSKYEHGIVNWELRITWSDGEVEVMQQTLPDCVLREIEQYVIDLEDLRAENPEEYFGANE